MSVFVAVYEVYYGPFPEEVDDEGADEATNDAEDHLVKHFLISQIQWRAHR